MSALCRETLCTPHRARRVAVMMMVAMRPIVHIKKINKIVAAVNRGFCRGDLEPLTETQSLAPGARSRGPRDIVVHAHFQIDGYARLPIFQFFHAHNLRHVLAVHRIVR